jgi:hypothetical protein
MNTFILFMRCVGQETGKSSRIELDGESQVMVRWVEQLSLSGNFVSGESFNSEVRFARPEILHDVHGDGEKLNGYIVINAENIDQAARLAQSCPLLGISIDTIEVRESNR